MNTLYFVKKSLICLSLLTAVLCTSCAVDTVDIEIETANKLVAVTDFADAAKLWMKDNFGNNFTAADVLKMADMILKNRNGV